MVAERGFVLTINRRDYFQVAYLAAKGLDARLRSEGIEKFRARMAAALPDLADRLKDRVQLTSDGLSIYRDAVAQVSGLARAARGPTSSRSTTSRLSNPPAKSCCPGPSGRSSRRWRG